RLLYAGTDLSLTQIAIRAGVHQTTISSWVRKYGWPARTTGFVPNKPADVAAAPTIANGKAAPEKAPPANRPAVRNPQKPTRRPQVSTLVDRLYRIIIRNLELMENRMSDDDKPAGDNPERDMRAIGNMVRSVEKLKEIEPEQSKRDAASAGGTKYPLSPDEEDRLRIEIVE
ncbi:unnamed protein product, partial [Phaeothamnion confervicola]